MWYLALIKHEDMMHHLHYHVRFEVIWAGVIFIERENICCDIVTFIIFGKVCKIAYKC